jgi:hypothetical protein
LPQHVVGLGAAQLVLGRAERRGSAVVAHCVGEGDRHLCRAHIDRKLPQLAEEIVAVLSQDPTATVKVSVEISADFPSGAPDHVKRAVSENANTLGLKRKEWE